MRSTRTIWGLAAALAFAFGCATAGDGDNSGDDAPDIDGATGPTIDADPSRPDSTLVGGDIDASTCASSPCDLVDQCGCAAPNVCDLDVSNLPNTHCRPVNSPGMDESTCASFNDCAGGFVCVSAADEASCRRYCRTNADCDAPRGACVITLVDGSTEIPGAVVCSSNCDPINPAAGGCPATWGCYPGVIDPDGVPGNGDETTIGDCAPAGAGTQGATCAANSDCAQGFLCINTGVTTECLRMCNTAVGDCSGSPGTTCGGTDPVITLGGVTYGICI